MHVIQTKQSTRMGNMMVRMTHVNATLSNIIFYSSLTIEVEQLMWLLFARLEIVI